ncbi:hypothetical protein N657DRAFT_633284 [Parathielavia appendiculata]|uniref:White collar 1 protein n=1 Tax=Parathielavia appendiculata TaxID=2587402 RepID=A0AAN6U0F0_9PEZI|nr:hypothetical protein N657DRAFT_633284 [Parathielavia appendiculata]
MNSNFYPSRLYPEEIQAQQWLALQQQNGANGHQGQGGGQGQSQGQGQDTAMSNAANLGGLDCANTLSAMDDMSLTREESLDDIVSQNVREFQRRRSLPQPFSDSLLPQNVDRRMAMMGFGSATDALHAFSFGFPNSAGLAGTSEAFPQQGLVVMPDQTGYPTLPPHTVGMGGFCNQDMVSMTADPASMSFFNPPNLQNQHPSAAMEAGGPNYAMDMGIESAPLNAPSVNPVARFTVGGSGGMMGGASDTINTNPVQETPGLILNTGMGRFPPNMSPLEPEPREPSVPASFQSPTSPTSRAMSQSSVGPASIAAGTPASTAPATAGPSLPPGLGSRDPKKDAYSKSGFDMLKALFYVATRKNPTVDIGAVDLSCAFVVCDVTLNDCPIIYVSDNFQNLTGYNRHEITGKNCRFLQSPDGKVEAGTKREFVANDAVFKLKNAVAEGREIQQSLINYRKGGKPFLNLLTMIPIPWDNSTETRYFIGFQVDLVECPEAISSQESGGAMQVNYRHQDIGQYFWTPPNSTQWSPESGQTLTVDEVSSLIQHNNPATSAPPRSEYHKSSWPKMLLENADDVIHVLSLKGLFLYLSPACKKLLEYDASELVGTSLSSICHPSDIVPVMRELKDAAQHNPSSVNIAFRIRRKHSGYTWFESHGSLVTDQPSTSSSSSSSSAAASTSGGGGGGAGSSSSSGGGSSGGGKGKKFIVLVGRKRPVLCLSRRDVDAHTNGIGGSAGDGSEVWSKISGSGMFLFVSSSVKALLELEPAELKGRSMQALMRQEARSEFGRMVEKARKGGGVVAFRHEVMHKRGQYVPAVTVLYPGDGARSGGRSSFLIAQTRLTKGAGGRVIAAPGKGHGQHVGGGGGTILGTMERVPDQDAVNHPMNGVVATGKLTASKATYPDSAPGEESPSGGDEQEEQEEESEDDIFAELRTTRCTSWQYELRQMEKMNRLLAEELSQLMVNKKKRKRRKGGGTAGGGNGSAGGAGVKDCANCHKRDTPEWRRGPSGNRDLCNSCGLRWAKQTGKVSPRNMSRAGSDGGGSKRSSISTTSTNSPVESLPLRREVSADAISVASSRLERRSTSTGDGSGGAMSGLEMGSILEE